MCLLLLELYFDQGGSKQLFFFCPIDIKTIYIVYSVTGHPYFQYDLLCAFFVVINVFIVFKTLIVYL